MKMCTPVALLLAILITCPGSSPSADAQGLPSEIGAEIAVGRNLTNDDCKLRRIQPADWGGDAERYALFCEGWSQQSGQMIVLRSDSRLSAWWLEESGWAQVILAAGDCEPPKAEANVSDLKVAARLCRHRLGWRQIMLVAKSESGTYVANFLPNNAPLIERALLTATGKNAPETSATQGRKMISLRALEELIGKDSELPSIREIGSIFELSRLAHYQHEARFYRTAELTWLRVLAAQERLFGLDSPALAMTLLNMSHPIRNQRRLDDALAFTKRAEPLVRKSHNPVLTSQLYNHFAFDAQWRRNYTAAITFNQDAIAALPDAWPGSSGWLAEVYFSLSIAQYATKDYKAAEKAARNSLSRYIKAQGPDSGWTNRVRMQLARILTAQKNFDEAESHLKDALPSAERMFGRTIWWANAKVLEAGLARAKDDPDRALGAYRAFASVAAREPFACFYGPCLSPYVDLLITRAGNDPDQAQGVLSEAFSAVQLFDFPVVSTAIQHLTARISAEDPELAAFTREQQDLAEQQTNLRAQLMVESRKAAKNRSPKREQSIESKIHKLQEKIDEQEPKLQDRFPKYAQLVSRRPVDARSIDEILQPDEALLYMSHVGDKGYTFLLHRNSLKIHTVNLSREQLRQKVTALRSGLTVEAGHMRPFDTALAHALYRDLVGSLLDSPGPVRRLVVIPAGPLLSLPPDVLVSGEPGTDGKIPWLARRFSILVVPDVRAFVNLRGMGKPPSSASGFLGIGNPRFDAGQSGPALSGRASNTGAMSRGIHLVSASKEFHGTSCAEKLDVRAQVARLAPLPESDDEVRVMSSSLGHGKAVVLLDEKATKSGLRKANPETWGIVAFATHGLLPDDLYCENEPSLALAPGPAGDLHDDGLLRASEIATMRLHATLVILSACNTAGADGRLGGESLSGLVRAFFYAGARNVLATHWSIASRPTVDLMKEMARRREQGMNWPEALTESKLRMMDDPATSHPFFWGAFSLVGGG
ncbi:MAG: CHAT domain-containing protein [Syntrophaceae bacterium]|nr:CHAT domain-containing protein [Syntrophaceae bacterium]